MSRIYHFAEEELTSSYGKEIKLQNVVNESVSRSNAGSRDEVLTSLNTQHTVNCFYL